MPQHFDPLLTKSRNSLNPAFCQHENFIGEPKAPKPRKLNIPPTIKETLWPRFNRH